MQTTWMQNDVFRNNLRNSNVLMNYQCVIYKEDKKANGKMTTKWPAFYFAPVPHRGKISDKNELILRLRTIHMKKKKKSIWHAWRENKYWKTTKKLRVSKIECVQLEEMAGTKTPFNFFDIQQILAHNSGFPYVKCNYI